MKDLFSDTNKIGLWFFPLNFRYVEKIKKTSRWCRNCRIHVVRVILKPLNGWLVMNKSCFVLSWNFLWVFWTKFRLVSKHIILLWFWIHYYAYLFTFWNSFWPMCTTIQLLFVFSDTIFIWVHLHSLIHITMDDRNAFELGLKSEGNAFKCNHIIGRFLINDFCCGL